MRRGLADGAGGGRRPPRGRGRRGAGVRAPLGRRRSAGVDPAADRRSGLAGRRRRRRRAFRRSLAAAAGTMNDGGRDGPRWLPWLLIPISLLSGPAAAFPWGSYFFRDFSITLLPYRLFAAGEWAAFRWPAWNPYLYDGTFLVPALYPGDLLHAFWPSPAAVSWLLTLHLPLAAFAAYRLARDLGARRSGACLAGSVYSLGGLAVSSL